MKITRTIGSPPVGGRFLALVALVSVVLVAAPAAAYFDVPESAVGEGVVHEGDARVESRLVVDAEQVTPGETITVGVHFQLDDEWHIYWQNPGQSGAPTDIEWQSDDLEFGPLQWSVPRPFQESNGSLTVYGYGDEVLLFSEATVAEDASGEVEIEAGVDYLACQDACLPGQSHLRRTIPVANQTTLADMTVLDAFQEYGARVPRRADEVGVEVDVHYSQEALRPGDDFAALVEIVDCEESGGECDGLDLDYDDLAHALMPDRHSVAEYRVEALEEHPDAHSGWVLALSGAIPDGAEVERSVLSGVMNLVDADGQPRPLYVRDEFDTASAGDEVAEADLPDLGIDTDAIASADEGAGQRQGAESGDEKPQDEPSTAWILLMAFAGGMILNLMPCVFPVLALKVSSFTRLVHESKQSVLAHGAAYTGGIVGSMLVLAGVVVGLRAAGTEVGWGFQFQEPHFLAALFAVLVLFSLNLFGVFEIGLEASSLQERADEAHGVRRSAWEGVLAVVLATPCSAPLLGTAVGFALASGTAMTVSVFAALGLGLASPMVVLTLMPGWAKLLPRPGDWMVHLKKFLGFALIGSAVWIVWLVGRQTGVDAMAQLLGFGGILAVAAWLYGLVQFRSWSTVKAGALGLGLVAVLSAAAFIFPLEVSSDQGRAESTSSADAIDWEPWSQKRV
ncbi:MAG: protein-disulfide reductase DsbD family protein, partial [Persicimonas sp.]